MPSPSPTVTQAVYDAADHVSIAPAVWSGLIAGFVALLTLAWTICAYYLSRKTAKESQQKLLAANKDLQDELIRSNERVSAAVVAANADLSQKQAEHDRFSAAVQLALNGDRTARQVAGATLQQLIADGHMSPSEVSLMVEVGRILEGGAP